MIQLFQGDCVEKMKWLADDSVDSVVTDPPYGISFMGRNWDHQVPGVDVWREALRVLKPGGHLLAFAGTRTQHRMASAIEDAGFEIRDMLAWTYGSGFPKSLDVSKAIDKYGGNPDLIPELGTMLKRSREKRGMSLQECDTLFCDGTTNYSWFEGRPAGQRPPNKETRDRIKKVWPEVTDICNKLDHLEREKIGSRATNDPTSWYSEKERSARYVDITIPASITAKHWEGWGTALKPALEPITLARKPFKVPVAANVLEYGTGAINIDGCRVPFAGESPKGSGIRNGEGNTYNLKNCISQNGGNMTPQEGRWPANLLHDGSDEATAPFGEASRFFYCAKASKRDRDEGLNNPRAGAGRTSGGRNVHPTVKPTELMRYLCRMVTPPGGVVLDPFMGSGSTGKAAVLEGFSFIGVDLEAQYVDIAKARIDAAIASLYDFLA